LSTALRELVCWRSVKKSRWLDHETWSGDGSPADPLQDLPTKANTLSVFLIPKADAELLAPRVAAASAAGRQTLDLFEYVMFDATALESIVAKLSQSRGTTADAGVNEYHQDMVDISARQLAGVASAVWAVRSAIVRLYKPDVADLIVRGIRAGQIDRSSVTPRILEHIRERLA